MYGKHHTEEAKDKIGEANKGDKAWNKKEKIKRQCIVCGTIKLYTLSQIKNGRGTFCSRKCQGKYLSEHNKGKNNPRWSEKIKRICETCGKEFEIIFSKKDAKYCSRECRKKERIKCICQYCGKVFFAREYEVRKGNAIFCSRSCTRKGRMNFPKHHTKPELIFEGICKKNNLDFHYVGDGQLWIGKRKKLNPDFIEANGKKICVEIMGAYWHSPLLNRNLRETALQSYREKHYKKYKWIPAFIWDTDLLREDAEQFVLNILKGVI